MRDTFRDRRLVWRVFLYGIGLLTAGAATIFLVGAILIRPPFEQQLVATGAWLATRVCAELVQPDPTGPPRLAASLYSQEGALLASSVNPPFRALSHDEVAKVHREGSCRVPQTNAVAFRCARSAEDQRYVILAPPALGFPLRQLGAVFAVIIVIASIGSFPLARSIVAPLGRVLDATRAFGGGDLSTRIRTSRRDEVGDLARAFDEMADRIERLIRAEKDLLANVSHELRTPMARIRVVLETAREDPKRAQSLLDEIGHDLGELEKLVEDVMQTIRLEVGAAPSLPVHRTRAALGTIVSEAVERFREIRPARGIMLDARQPFDVVDADEPLLRRLVANLLQNADKFSPEGSPIEVLVEADGSWARVSVKDKGVGIDPGDLPHVFEPFFRGDRSRTHRTGGAGLGLALAKRIVDVHDGTIEIESAKGVGTTVVFRIPAIRPA